MVLLLCVFVALKYGKDLFVLPPSTSISAPDIAPQKSIFLKMQLSADGLSDLLSFNSTITYDNAEKDNAGGDIFMEEANFTNP
ncbi:hypothetical protein C0995_008642 [Termitomyces sp. Mi166|nr:hypothetical protein C0995_008642 [Termitomyces sp. Mi166\